MDRLSLYLTVMAGAVIAGSIVIAAFAMGYYSFWPVVIAGVVSLLITWPVSYLISRRIKRQDPNWDRAPDRGQILPDPKKPEV